jgi:hypothetical protein
VRLRERSVSAAPSQPVEPAIATLYFSWFIGGGPYSGDDEDHSQRKAFPIIVYTNLSFWENGDSSPPITAKKNELVISSGVGWSF